MHAHTRTHTHTHTFWVDSFRKKNAREALYRAFDLSNVEHTP